MPLQISQNSALKSLIPLTVGSFSGAELSKSGAQGLAAFAQLRLPASQQREVDSAAAGPAPARSAIRRQTDGATAAGLAVRLRPANARDVQAHAGTGNRWGWPGETPKHSAWPRAHNSPQQQPRRRSDRVDALKKHRRPTVTLAREPLTGTPIAFV